LQAWLSWYNSVDTTVAIKTIEMVKAENMMREKVARYVCGGVTGDQVMHILLCYF